MHAFKIRIPPRGLPTSSPCRPVRVSLLQRSPPTIACESIRNCARFNHDSQMQRCNLRTHTSELHAGAALSSSTPPVHHYARPRAPRKRHNSTAPSGQNTPARTSSVESLSPCTTFPSSVFTSKRQVRIDPQLRKIQPRFPHASLHFADAYLLAPCRRCAVQLHASCASLRTPTLPMHHYARF